MPPLDWGRIMGADIDALREDLDAADDMYGVLEMVNYKTTMCSCVAFLATGFWFSNSEVIWLIILLLL